MAIGLLEESETQGAISYRKLIEENHLPDERNYSIYSLMELFHRWTHQAMSYKDLGRVQDLPKRTKGLSSDEIALMAVLMECICEVGIASIKKERMLVEHYETLNQETQQTGGMELRESPEMVMRYIVSLIEHLGFKRIKNDVVPNAIDVSQIEYDEYS